MKKGILQSRLQKGASGSIKDLINLNKRTPPTTPTTYTAAHFENVEIRPYKM
jgi:hypothetical protein